MTHSILECQKQNIQRTTHLILGKKKLDAYRVEQQSAYQQKDMHPRPVTDRILLKLHIKKDLTETFLLMSPSKAFHY